MSHQNFSDTHLAPGKVCNQTYNLIQEDIKPQSTPVLEPEFTGTLGTIY